MSDAQTDTNPQPTLDLGDDAQSAAPEEDFETIYTRLESVAAQLEAGNLSLEQSVALYEEGMRLAQQCQALLRRVEQRIEQLQALADEDDET